MEPRQASSQPRSIKAADDPRATRNAAPRAGDCLAPVHARRRPAARRVSHAAAAPAHESRAEQPGTLEQADDAGTVVPAVAELLANKGARSAFPDANAESEGVDAAALPPGTLALSSTRAAHCSGAMELVRLLACNARPP